MVKTFLRVNVPYLIILFVFLIFSSPYWLKGKIPFPSTYLVNNFRPWQYYYALPVKNNAMPDIGSQIFPWRFLSIQSLKNKQWPLWNPYNFSGTPLLANFQSAPFHPANFLFFLFSTINAWSFLILLPPLLACLFTFLFLKEVKVSPISALVGALGFAFCGFMVCWLAYGTLSWAILWLPLCLFCIEKHFHGKWLAGAVFSLSIAFSLFSGHFQISLYLLLVVFFYFLAKTFKTGDFKKGIFLFLFLGGGLLLASPQLLPTYEFYQQSVRSQYFQISEAIPLNYLVTLLAPDFFGNPVTRNDWFGHYAEWAGFVGVIPLMLTVYGFVFKKKDFYFKFFSLVGLFSLLIAVRSPFQDFLVNLRIPVISTSAFSRIIVIFSFSLAVLSAFGLEQLRQDWQKRNTKKVLIFLIGLGAVFIFIWAIILFGKFKLQGVVDSRQVAKRNFILPTGLFFAAAAAFLFGCFSKKNYQQWLIILIIFLTSLDLLRFATKWMPFESREYFYPPLEVIQFLQDKTAGIDRVFGNFGSELNTFSIPGLEGYDPLYIKRYGEFITTARDGKIGQPTRLTVYLDKNGQYTFRILNLLGTKYFLHAKEDGRNIWVFPFWEYPEDFEKIWEDEKYEIFENKKALPRAFLVNDYQVAQSNQEIIDLMYHPKTDLSKTVVLEKEVTATIQPSSHLPAGRQGSTINGNSVDITEYTPTKIEIKVNNPQPGILFLSDIFYPGWEAFVDEQKTTILRANFTFRSVIVPAGDHKVIFKFNPPLFKLGLFSSLISFLFMGIISIIGKRDENRTL